MLTRGVVYGILALLCIASAVYHVTLAFPEPLVAGCDLVDGITEAVHTGVFAYSAVVCSAISAIAAIARVLPLDEQIRGVFQPRETAFLIDRAHLAIGGAQAATVDTSKMTVWCGQKWCAFSGVDVQPTRYELAWNVWVPTVTAYFDRPVPVWTHATFLQPTYWPLFIFAGLFVFAIACSLSNVIADWRSAPPTNPAEKKEDAAPKKDNRDSANNLVRAIKHGAHSVVFFDRCAVRYNPSNSQITILQPNHTFLYAKVNVERCPEYVEPEWRRGETQPVQEVDDGSLLFAPLWRDDKIYRFGKLAIFHVANGEFVVLCNHRTLKTEAVFRRIN